MSVDAVELPAATAGRAHVDSGAGLVGTDAPERGRGPVGEAGARTAREDRREPAALRRQQRRCGR
jgi:hypothetical protein